ncbi:MAG: hypothetical protein WA813_17405 [Beijerinckiaceae bacterium]
MNTIVFLPGILGSSLSLNGDEVWPPTPTEAVFGYHRIPQLMDPGVVATGVIQNVVCYEVYKPICDDLTYIASHTPWATRTDFFYDWRKDIKTVTAPLLAQTLQNLVAGGAQSIALVCHSMGGLVARLVLENDQYKAMPWMSAVKQFLGICNPHHGAPQALAEALGLVGTSGIDASDMPTLTSNSSYPAAYQNLPAPHYNRLRKQPGNVPLNVYDNTVASQFGLNPQNTSAAMAAFSAMDMSKKPATVEYHLFAGNAQTTLEQINVTGSVFSMADDAAGDGTVPLWSAAPGPIPAFVTAGDHLGVMKTGPFRNQLYKILTGEQLMARSFAARPVVTISLNKLVYAPGEQMTVLIIPDTRAHELTGKLQITRATDAKATAFAQHGAEFSVHYAGAPVPHLAPMHIRAPQEIGAYRLTFDGNHATTDVTSAAFVVSRTGGFRSSR